MNGNSSRQFNPCKIKTEFKYLKFYFNKFLTKKQHKVR